MWFFGGLPRGRGIDVSLVLKSLFHCDGDAAAVVGDADAGGDADVAGAEADGWLGDVAVGEADVGGEIADGGAAEERVVGRVALPADGEAAGGVGDAGEGVGTGVGGAGAEGGGVVVRGADGLSSSKSGRSVDLSSGLRRWMDSESCASKVTSADVMTLRWPWHKTL